MSADVETMFSGNRIIPWHRQGTVVDGVKTAAEAIQLAELDWEVELWPLEAVNSDLPRLSLQNNYGVVRRRRSGTVDSLDATVKGKYVPLQNVDAFGFFDTLVDSGEAKYETAGALDHGRKVWLLAKIPAGINIGGVDPVDLYGLLTNSHDGGSSVTVAVTPIRVVCTNTLNLAMRRAQRQWKVRHVATATRRILEAREALELTFTYVTTFEEEAQRLLAKPMTERSFKTVLEKLAKDLDMSDRRVESFSLETTRLFVEGDTLDNIRGTYWAALNAISEVAEWYNPRFANPETQVRSNVEGNARKVRDHAMALLTS